MSDQPAAGSVNRDEALDNTKGIAILAVVIFHMTRGFTNSGQIASSTPLQLADATAYGFHVQTFFMIAGYLAFPKAGSFQVQLGRQASLYYAYLLWSLISWTISSAMANSVNHPVSFHELLLIPIVPIQHFWFLLPLMLGTALMGILRTPLPLILGCVAVAIPMIAPQLAEIGIYGGVFYVLFGGLLRAANVRPKAHLLLGIIGAAVLFGGAWNEVHSDQWFSGQIFNYLVTLSGCYAAYVAGSYAMRSSIVGSTFGTLGRHSMSIFLIHTITGSGLRIILSHAAPGLNVLIAIVLTILSGVCLPIAIELLAERMGVATLLGLKSFRIRLRQTANASH